MGDSLVVPEGLTEFRWLRLLARATSMAEGWSADDSPATTSLGVVPTPDARVVEVWQRFATLMPHVLPLVDGDAAGKAYVKRLKELPRKPTRIARLGDGAALERVLTWVLFPDLGPPEWEQIEDVVGQLPSRDLAGLHQTLQGEVKTRYDLHELLAGLIALRPLAAARGRRFLNTLRTIAAGAEPPDTWERDDDESTAEVEVLRWIVPGAP